MRATNMLSAVAAAALAIIPTAVHATPYFAEIVGVTGTSAGASGDTTTPETITLGTADLPPALQPYLSTSVRAQTVAGLGPIPSNGGNVPLTAHADGSIIVDTSSYSGAATYRPNAVGTLQVSFSVLGPAGPAVPIQFQFPYSMTQSGTVANTMSQVQGSVQLAAGGNVFTATATQFLGGTVSVAATRGTRGDAALAADFLNEDVFSALLVPGETYILGMSAVIDAWAIASFPNGYMDSASATAEIDPLIRIDPAFPDIASYALQFEPGVFVPTQGGGGIPEPGTLTLLGFGLSGLWVLRRRRDI